MKRKDRPSKAFSDSYKLFLEEKISLSVLKKRMETPNDVIFYHKFCDPKGNLSENFKIIVLKKLESFINVFLSEMEKCDEQTKKQVARKVLTVFVGLYSCYVEGVSKECCKDIILHFSQEIEEGYKNDTMNEEILEMLNLLITLRDWIEDKESIVRPIVFKLTSLYAAFAISDKGGRIKCNQLGKQLSTNWHKSTPESVALSYLKRREGKSRISISEVALLEKYSFGLRLTLKKTES